MKPGIEAFEQKLATIFATYSTGDVRLVREVRLILSARRDVLVELHSGDGLDLVRRLSDTVDQLLRTYLGSYVGGMGLALLALGGYGRGELSPRSDVDVLVLYPEGAQERASAFTGPLLAFLWDVGHVVGHSTRSLDQCGESMAHDLPTATALLEGRLVGGSRTLFRQYVEEVTEPWLLEHREEFIEQKVAEARSRHDFYGGSPLLAMPNVKESAGGLRDMHVSGWLGLALSGRKDFKVYREAGILDEEGDRALLEAYSTVHRVRNALHLAAGAKQDTLDFSLRPKVAESLGFVDGEGFKATERLMRSYYQAALVLSRFLERVVRFREGCPADRRRVLPGNLVDAGGEAYPADETAIDSPEAALAAVAVMTERGLDPSPDLIEAVARVVPQIDDAVRSSREMADRLLDLLRLPGAARGLRTLYRTGLLSEYLPEFGRLFCLSREDPYHQYTVDEHSLTSVASLDSFASEEGAVSEELARVTRPDLLRLALLLHDVGKAWGEDHVARGLTMIPDVTRRLGLDHADAELVRFLVAEHLLMTSLADKRVPSEAAAILAERVKDRPRLRCLYLHTRADVMAAGRGALSGWRAAQLARLYEDALALLSPRPSRPDEVVSDEARGHLEAMGRRYALEVEPGRVAMHLDLVARLADTPAALAAIPSEAYAEVWIGARDAKGLFARISGVLTLHDLDIGAAHAYTRDDGVALDGFFVTRAGEPPPEDSSFWKEVAGELVAALSGEDDLEERLERYRRRYRPDDPPAAPGPPCGATASNRVSNRFTVVEVTARDRPCLLHDLARAVTARGFSIHDAVIATRGAVVLDTFHLTREDGGRPTMEELSPLLADLDALAKARVE